MRTGAVVALLGVVLAASALDLALGTLWVVALLGVILLRRRIRLAAPLVFLTAAALLAGGGHRGWFPSPPPVSYEIAWVPGWLRAGSAPLPADGPPIEAVRQQLAALTREEVRLTGPEIEQRAGAVIALARRLGPWRAEAPREVAAVEAAMRRLTRTLAAPEFRDLEARRATVAAYLADLDKRLGAVRDASETAAVLRAADPAAMAPVSLRPVHEDLAAAGAAIEALVGVLGGGVPAATASATARYQEDRGQIRWEMRYAVSGTSGVRLLRVETRAFRGAAPPGVPLRLAYSAGGEAARPVPGGGWVELEPAPRGVDIIATWAEPAAPRPVRAALRPVVFGRLEVAASPKSDDALIMAVLDGRPGVEIPLAVRLPPSRLIRVAVPRHALYFAHRPGTVTLDAEGEHWEPAGEGAATLTVELVPKSFLLRNAAFASVRGYLYGPNAGAVLTAIGLAALLLMLVRRPRPPGVESR